MKFLALALTLFAFSLSDSFAMGMKSFGGVMFSETPSGDWFKIKSARLNVAVICEAFGVSPNDYRLHYQSQFDSRTNFLELRPHISDSGLPITPCCCAPVMHIVCATRAGQCSRCQSWPRPMRLRRSMDFAAQRGGEFLLPRPAVVSAARWTTKLPAPARRIFSSSDSRQ
jgi:hypothetical protein